MFQGLFSQNAIVSSPKNYSLTCVEPFQHLFPPKRIVRLDRIIQGYEPDPTKFQHLFPPKRIVSFFYSRILSRVWSNDVSAPFSSEEDR